MILFAMALALQPSAEDAEICAAMQANAAQENVPFRIDAVTEGLATEISCATRTVVFNKRVSLAEVPAGWRDYEQGDWSRFVCNGTGFGPMIRRGWTFREVWTFGGGQREVFDASCAGLPAAPPAR